MRSTTQQVRNELVALAATVLFVSNLPSLAAASSGDHLRLLVASFASPTVSGSVASTWPGLPPPISGPVLEKFSRLLASYAMLSGWRDMSFGEWLFINGVTDPREWHCMMWLYWRQVSRGQAG